MMPRKHLEQRPAQHAVHSIIALGGGGREEGGTIQGRQATFPARDGQAVPKQAGLGREEGRQASRQTGRQAGGGSKKRSLPPGS